MSKTAQPKPPVSAKKAWALLTPAGFFLLAAIGPTPGAVAAWIEREMRRGLAVLKDGFRVEPVTIAPDPSRDTADVSAFLNVMRRNAR